MSWHSGLVDGIFDRRPPDIFWNLMEQVLGLLQQHPTHLNCRFLDQRANRSDQNKHQVQSGDEGAG